jgi:hypothetical protein
MASTNVFSLSQALRLSGFSFICSFVMLIIHFPSSIMAHTTCSNQRDEEEAVGLLRPATGERAFIERHNLPIKTSSIDATEARLIRPTGVEGRSMSARSTRGPVVRCFVVSLATIGLAVVIHRSYTRDPLVVEGGDGAALRYALRSNRALFVGDGRCDTIFNDQTHGFDGGDCCLTTCRDGYFRCLDAAVCKATCLDPAGSNIGCEETRRAKEESGGDPDWVRAWKEGAYHACPAAVTGNFDSLGDGHCDDENNSPLCRWDGGDCCVASCKDGVFGCRESGVCQSECRDPSALTTAEGVSHEDFCRCPHEPSKMSDGHCDDVNANVECSWDGNDCAVLGAPGGEASEVTDSRRRPRRGSRKKNGKITRGELLWPDCPGIPSWAGDSHCDMPNNNELCGWDGGDCCWSTCEEGAFGCLVGCNPEFPCLDPNGDDNGCEEEAAAPGARRRRQWPQCVEVGGLAEWIGDGQCDMGNNIEPCGWDGGDCCHSTCRDSGPVTCIDAGVCSDTAPCLDPGGNDDLCDLLDPASRRSGREEKR